MIAGSRGLLFRCIAILASKHVGIHPEGMEEELQNRESAVSESISRCN